MPIEKLSVVLGGVIISVEGDVWALGAAIIIVVTVVTVIAWRRVP
jgi:hypothetical protein